ncbi:GNAT family N-acetyltransferase [Tamlana fucoidanivorans]|uniref:GNAT family N-acetyltransferase n=1 Tax=Allotamlana fucoidanivorans TaxID=2583814 RepID=A0A5C4SF70_9FLAO|nr:GNAT family N-acetyltransferase [Tamlana fucoidanivorans]TNJ42118.1 GNAT family N-acetyltransferase [Tamlana fucoidanivorans]
MEIKIFDAFTRLSTMNINQITNFLHKYSGDFKDSKFGIRKSIMYAAKEIPGIGGYVLVIEDATDIVGAAVVNKTGMKDYIPENILVNLAIKPSYRGKGIAKTLIRQLKSYCKGSIALHINPENPAIALFKKEGFKVANIEMRLMR